MLLTRRIFAPLLGALALLTASVAPAQQHLPAPQPVKAAPAPPEAHPAMWKVADEDTTIYLFGTIHLLPQGVEWFDGRVANAFEQSGELVTEIPEVDETATATSLLKHGMLPAKQSLRALMSKREKAKYEAAMKQMGLPVSAFDRFKPWYAAVVFATLPLQQKGYDLAHGVESQLSGKNKALGHTRLGLETLDYQLGIFDGFSTKVQKRYLFDVIAALPTLDKDVGEMVAAWTRGDAAALAKLMNAEQDDPALMAALLTNRNKVWAQWIKARLAQPGTVFIAVGAGHLGGKGSVQDQLAKAGVVSTRVQ